MLPKARCPAQKGRGSIFFNSYGCKIRTDLMVYAQLFKIVLVIELVRVQGRTNAIGFCMDPEFVINLQFLQSGIHGKTEKQFPRSCPAIHRDNLSNISMGKGIWLE